MLLTRRIRSETWALAIAGNEMLSGDAWRRLVCQVRQQLLIGNPANILQQYSQLADRLSGVA